MDEVYDIKLVDDARVYSVRMPRRVLLPLMPKLKHELGRLQKQGVIEPTEWCVPIVAVPKASGEIRLCVDLNKLNRAVRREKNIMPFVDHVLGQLGEANVLSKLDANSGFHQVLLTEQSKKLATFLTPFGRYCYNRLPFGISSAPGHFQKQASRTIAGLSGVVCLMDDILVYGKDQAEHDSRLRATLERLQKAGMTLNKGKCEMNKTPIRFLGHIVGADGVSADFGKVSAIQKYPCAH